MASLPSPPPRRLAEGVGVGCSLAAVPAGAVVRESPVSRPLELGLSPGEATWGGAERAAMPALPVRSLAFPPLSLALAPPEGLLSLAEPESRVDADVAG